MNAPFAKTTRLLLALVALLGLSLALVHALSWRPAPREPAPLACSGQVAQLVQFHRISALT